LFPRLFVFRFFEFFPLRREPPKGRGSGVEGQDPRAEGRLSV